MGNTIAIERLSNRHSRGMTLIEIMIVLLIMGIVAAGISAILATARQSENTITDQNEMQRRAQLAVDTIVDSLRDYSGVQTGDAGQVTAVAKDSNGNTLRTMKYYLLQNGELKRDHYEVDTTTHQLICVESGKPICSDVSALSFGYSKRDATQVPAAVVTAVLIEDTESLRVAATLTSGQNRATETSWVKFRNKYN